MGQEYSSEDDDQEFKNYVNQLKADPNFTSLDPEEVQRLKQRLSK